MEKADYRHRVHLIVHFFSDRLTLRLSVSTGKRGGCQAGYRGCVRRYARGALRARWGSQGIAHLLSDRSRCYRFPIDPAPSCLERTSSVTYKTPSENFRQIKSHNWVFAWIFFFLWIDSIEHSIEKNFPIEKKKNNIYLFNIQMKFHELNRHFKRNGKSRTFPKRRVTS